MRRILKFDNSGGSVLANYNTQQKKLLIDFLTAHSGQAFSAEEIYSALTEGSEEAPGRSTVYRLINRLCDDGTVKRFVPDGTKRFRYQIAGGEECHHHLHLKCTECGRLLHMRDTQSDDVLDMIFGDCGFSVDREHTTLFGCCDDCRRRDEKEKM